MTLFTPSHKCEPVNTQYVQNVMATHPIAVDGNCWTNCHPQSQPASMYKNLNRNHINTEIARWSFP